MTEEKKRYDPFYVPWFCPFCGKEVPRGEEPASWACCGEVGRATPHPWSEGEV